MTLGMSMKRELTKKLSLRFASSLFGSASTLRLASKPTNLVVICARGQKESGRDQLSMRFEKEKREGCKTDL
jgi:hypothetical protein